MQQLDPTDAAYVYLEHRALPLQIVAVFIFESTRVETDDAAATQALMARLAHRAAMMPELRRRLRRVPFDLDYPYWIDDESFRPARHIHTRYAGGAGWEYLRHRLERLAATQLDLDAPPWELHVDTGLHDIDGAEYATAITLKMHHALGDGLFSVAVLRGLLGTADPNETGDAPRPDSSSTTASRRHLLRSALRHQPAQVARLARGVKDIAAASRTVARLDTEGTITLPQHKRPRTRFNHKPRPTRTFDALSVSVPEIRAAKAAVPDVTVNDFLLTMISRAMELYLSDCGEPIPSNLAALVPMSTRGKIDKPSANQFDALIVDLHNDEPDLYLRCIAISNSVRTDKCRDLNGAVQRSRSLLQYLPSTALAATSLINRHWPDTGSQVGLSNTMITNVRRGADDLTLDGGRVVSSYGLPALDSRTALNHGIYTIGDTLTICFVADRDAVPDAAAYKSSLQYAYEETTRALTHAGS
ncbi:wax ester/triacylglycerol synthase domain-containing protein [Tomitella gaofuii]|uniref:wax ester/triacylglycerol synthase domain-containing protein n=1 Tax=Tomitella gaofuii TaxID=2760083 RepID=UPI0015FADA44|nr:wax ester/triacylglycerol synthase domain-containing protein [Tomitella gaofuii]